MKQTAVQWLVDHFKKLQSDGEKMSWNQVIEIVELAKKEERQQIEDANIAGMEFIPVDPNRYKEDAANYYTQTYEQ
jgi:hypothetical protein